ncbi:hypothetical protein AA313_de0210402 [Arthrobotrys entomopaga]|nr:hypothetical protein AA313_de0210402 [Arthrobotrys entomopaga]
MVDTSARVFETLLGTFVAIVLWVDFLVVHAHPTDESSLASRGAYIGEEVCSGNVDGSVVCRRRGAVGESAGYAAGIDCSSGGEGGERGFSREGVLVQPVEESRGAEYASVGVLRGVDVGVLIDRQARVSNGSI